MNDDNFLQIKPDEDESVIENVEQIVLACAFNNCKEIEEIFLQLKPDDFQNINNRQIFAVLSKLWSENKSIDLLTILDYMKENNEFQFDNYQQYIYIVDSKYLMQPNVLQYLDIIKNNSIKHRLFEFSKTLETTNLDTISARDKLWSLEKEFLNITNDKKSKSIESISKILDIYNKKIDQISDQNGEITGVTSGYKNIDKLTSGFQGGDLIILAARPGIGKTALALNFLMNSALKYKEENLNKKNLNEKNKIVLMFSMEMGNLQICQRVVSMESGVDMNVTKNGKMDEIQYSSISETISRLYETPFFIDDSSDLTIVDIQSKIKQLSNDNEIKLIVIDYLQLLKENKSSYNINRQQEVSNISRTLKTIARQYNVPIIAIAQLSRKIEERKGDAKKPILSDLRESGSIEQDADLVCFLTYKDEAINENRKDYNNVLVDFIVAKNRNGAIGNIELLFVKPISKYYDASLRK